MAAGNIQWRHSLEEARREARQQGKLLLIDLFNPNPWREPEALYFDAVAQCKASHDVNKLVEGWNRLMDRFPESDWAHKAESIRK